ncbi:hypothetical protein ASZ90_006267 [hydrocarbon metagenome]|uniref:Uncharacterized protein n=1 Tax=hydrocarbon metagenome TaxID=938273 RepID=A0A0W8FUL3_9ZZZZ
MIRSLEEEMLSVAIMGPAHLFTIMVSGLDMSIMNIVIEPMPAISNNELMIMRTSRAKNLARPGLPIRKSNFLVRFTI